jgi:hypothetical protein
MTLARRVSLLILIGSIGSACGGPLFVIPGGGLAGEVVREPVADWSFLDGGLFELETRPDAPYSVRISYRVVDGEVYIDPAEGRRWLDNLRADPRVLGRFDGRVYRLNAVLVGEPGRPFEGFPPDRFVYRLESRTP